MLTRAGGNCGTTSGEHKIGYPLYFIKENKGSQHGALLTLWTMINGGGDGNCNA